MNTKERIYGKLGVDYQAPELSRLAFLNDGVAIILPPREA